MSNIIPSRKTGLDRLALLASGHSEKAEAIQAESAYIKGTGGPVTTVCSFNLFQTPKGIARLMVDQLGDCSGCTMLEPSAGLGRLFKAFREKWPSEAVTLVEQAPNVARHLEDSLDGNSRLIVGDFLGLSLWGFDRVLMNPPFKMGADIKHTLHAYSLLNPGGVLVGLCYDGVKQNEKLIPLVDSWEVLPAKSFRESGTDANAILFKWSKN